MKLDRQSIASLAEIYATALSLFKRFVSTIEELNITSLRILPDKDAEETQFGFSFLGSRFLIRLRVGPADDGQNVAIMECMRWDESEGKFTKKSRCFLHVDGRVIFDSRTSFEPGIPTNSEFIFYRFLSELIPTIDKSI